MLLPKNNLRGFTLIELMVAISIIAILSSIGMVVYSKTQSLGRDSKRKQDLRALTVALEVYYQQNNSYPPSGGSTCSYGGSSYCVSADTNDPWIPGLNTNYINKMPKDPLADTNSPWWQKAGYSYIRCSATSYTVTAYLENTNDPDSMQFQHPKFCTGQDPNTFGGWSPGLYLITVRN